MVVPSFAAVAAALESDVTTRIATEEFTVEMVAIHIDIGLGVFCRLHIVVLGVA